MGTASASSQKSEEITACYLGRLADVGAASTASGLSWRTSGRQRSRLRLGAGCRSRRQSRACPRSLSRYPSLHRSHSLAAPSCLRRRFCMSRFRSRLLLTPASRPKRRPRRNAHRIFRLRRRTSQQSSGATRCCATLYNSYQAHRVGADRQLSKAMRGRSTSRGDNARLIEADRRAPRHLRPPFLKTGL